MNREENKKTIAEFDKGADTEISNVEIQERLVNTLSKVPFKLDPEFGGSNNFEYNNKVLKHKLKELIAELVKNIGQGRSEPVPYDTAWVARIPQIDDVSLPAFPLSLQWLRDHQLEDGSWGSVKPFSSHSNTLNTLAAVIALAQWNNPDDEVRIENGVTALWRLADLLPSEQHKTIGSELILFTLLNEAGKYGLAVPYVRYESYKQKSNSKLELILSEFEKYGFSKPATWWHSLEVLGDKMQTSVGDNELRFSPEMLAKNSSVALSPAATAYVLMSHRLKGIDIPSASSYLQNLYSQYAGGIPHIYPIDTFELARSLDFLRKSRFHAKHPLLKSAIKHLAESWNPKYGVGCSINWEIFNADDSAVALSILLEAGYDFSPEPILKFFNGIHIATYNGEAAPSISANINALNTLKLFKGDKEIDEVIQKILVCMDKYALDDQIFLDDKLNISPYYSTSRAVFTLHGLRDDIVKRCLKFFIKNQNSDGGWGKDGFTTAEETAYVSLALCHGLMCGYPIPIAVLELASSFLFNSHKLDTSPLWVGKVLYHPTLVAKSARISSQLALIKTLELVKVKSILETIQPRYLLVNVETTANEKNYHAFILCLAQDFDTAKHSDQIAKVRAHIANKFIELNLIKSDKKLETIILPDFILYALGKGQSDEDLTLLMYYIASIFIYDNIIDKKNDNLEENHIKIIEKAFKAFTEILRGKYESIDAITPINFPKFISLCKLHFDMRRLLIKTQEDLSEFLSGNEEVLSNWVKESYVLLNKVALSAHDYLEMKAITGYGYTIHRIFFLIEKVQTYSFRDYANFREFEDSSVKNIRLLIDLFSFRRDIAKGTITDNYVFVKQRECNCSIEDAMVKTVKLINKLIIRMYTMKKAMLEDPKYENDKELRRAILIIETTLQGTINWSTKSKRYQADTAVTFTTKQLTEVNIPLILQFFENEATDISCLDLELEGLA